MRMYLKIPFTSSSSSYSTFAIIFLLVIYWTASEAEGRQLGACALAEELVFKYDVTKDEAAHWVCLVQHESNFDTERFGRHNPRSCVSYHGLFGIDDQEYCKEPSRVFMIQRGCSGTERELNKCNTDCGLLRDNDIEDDVSCAKRIHSMSGFGYWQSWRTHCEEDDDIQRYVSACDLENRPRADNMRISYFPFARNVDITSGFGGSDDSEPDRVRYYESRDDRQMNRIPQGQQEELEIVHISEGSHANRKSFPPYQMYMTQETQRRAEEEAAEMLALQEARVGSGSGSGDGQGSGSGDGGDMITAVY